MAIPILSQGNERIKRFLKDIYNCFFYCIRFAIYYLPDFLSLKTSKRSRYMAADIATKATSAGILHL